MVPFGRAWTPLRAADHSRIIVGVCGDGTAMPEVCHLDRQVVRFARPTPVQHDTRVNSRRTLGERLADQPVDRLADRARKNRRRGRAHTWQFLSHRLGLSVANELALAHHGGQPALQISNARYRTESRRHINKRRTIRVFFDLRPNCVDSISWNWPRHGSRR